MKGDNIAQQKMNRQPYAGKGKFFRRQKRQNNTSGVGFVITISHQMLLILKLSFANPFWFGSTVMKKTNACQEAKWNPADRESSL